MIPPSTPGVVDSAKRIAGSALAYGEARWQLLCLEGKEALTISLRAIILVGLALLSAALAFVAASVGLTLWLARAFWQGDVLPACWVVMGILLSITTIAGLVAYSSWKSSTYFTHSKAEFQTDKLWLNRNLPSRS